MSLFSAGAIADYSLRVSSALQNHELYNRVKFHNMYFGVTRQRFNDSLQRGPVFVQYQTDMNLLTNNGMENLCSNSVGRWYTIDAIASAFAMPLTYDILFALDNGIMLEPETMENTLKKKMRRAVAGVIIVQKGECINRRESWCVKVICVRPNTLRGSILMGACLYCIKNAPDIKQECLLELTDGYSNLPAFYSYTALGFLRDDSLWGEGCFNTEGCMPMRANVAVITPDDIIKKVLGTAPLLKLSVEEDPSGLWNRKCEVAKYKKNDPKPGYAVLKEIQTINNVILGLTLLKNAYKPDITSEVTLHERYRSSWFGVKPNVFIRRQLSAKLNAKLDEFDRLAGELPGAGCTISGGRGRKRTRGKGTRGKRARGIKTRRRKYYNPK
jgi:hypothetical protein